MTAFQVHLIGIAGPSGAGKSTLAVKLAGLLQMDSAAVVSLDWYYRDLSALPAYERDRTNFDAPLALDWPLIEEQLGCLAQGGSVQRPVYDFKTHTRSTETVFLEPKPIMIVEGLLVLFTPKIRSILSTRLFLQLSDNLCLERRTARDVRERGRSVESVKKQYANTVRPMGERYVMPSRRYADWIGDSLTDPGLLAAQAAAVIQKRMGKNGTLASKD